MNSKFLNIDSSLDTVIRANFVDSITLSEFLILNPEVSLPRSKSLLVHDEDHR